MRTRSCSSVLRSSSSGPSAEALEGLLISLMPMSPPGRSVTLSMAIWARTERGTRGQSVGAGLLQRQQGLQDGCAEVIGCEGTRV